MTILKNKDGIWTLDKDDTEIAVKQEIEIFDTTLRDGEQGGVTFKGNSKQKIAGYLATTGVSTIEVGFPSSNLLEFEMVKEIADSVEGPYICGLTTMDFKNIHKTWDALKNNPNPTIHVFTLNIDEASIRAYNADPQEQIKKASEAVSYAKKLMGGKGRVEFSAQNTILALSQSLHSEHLFLQDYIAGIYGGAIKEGADVINIPHTVAKGIEIKIGEAVRYFKMLVEGTDDVMLSFHAHNDFGVSVADTLEAIEQGIRQVEGTWYSLGERAGNTPLEQVIMNLSLKPIYKRHFFTGFDLSKTNAVARLVEKESGIPIPYNAPGIGPNALRHGSGVHSDGDKKGKAIGEYIYLPCTPEDLGWTGNTHQITKLTGVAGVTARLSELGFGFEKKFVKKHIMPVIKSRDITYGDKELRMIGDDFRYPGEEYILFVDYAFNKFANSSVRQAQVELIVDGQKLTGEAFMGKNGPINAVFSAIDDVIGLGVKKPKLVVYEPSNRGRTHSSEAEALVVLSGNGKDIDYNLSEPVWVGRAVDEDTITASAKSYVQALSRFMADMQDS
ncbi:alpha-isopropylmalate synthase regulatory domain-containing protein [Desulfosarcina ovata]|uniref:2-isopropylmalate synthase n=1 Tax=Desulfosarcina ovata subsp. ovata TaxID=2752305 RepID=A0A5K8AGJ7_9BACT|nr:alpha-isopropylmalate synthase regulatory domain-containing protein [Desulfosarcina ovata]BBO91688.1 2-isopropylmalate synthase [Desulfosarcina ovata subsp. ovata]